MSERLKKEYLFKDFVRAMAFVNQVAEIAEQQNHHPDIAIHYNQVELTFWTHTTGTVTEKDHRLAEAIQKVVDP